ncbi:hypothetical protein BTZ20_1652 [Rhodococcus sp. MTM3W5.2]|nr:hypothetical protein BTZ20_1652 [Rhodococcus sp. MTM3W5.2]
MDPRLREHLLFVRAVDGPVHDPDVLDEGCQRLSGCRRATVNRSAASSGCSTASGVPWGGVDSVIALDPTIGI